MQRNNSIMCLRVVSMFLIIMCHIVKYYTFIPGYTYLSQFFNVGVQIFLLISGYLYGKRTIEDFNKWLYARAKKIWIPMIIVVSIDLLILSLLNVQIDIVTAVIYLLNLQGLSFLSWNFFGKSIAEITNLGPLWFATMIMLCYLCLPFLQRYRAVKLDKAGALRNCLITFGVFYVLIIILAAAGICDLSYIWLFAVAYCGSAFGFRKEYTSVKGVIVMGVVTLLLQVVRVILKVKYEFPYYSTYVIISHAVLGAYIFYIAFFLEKRFPDLVYKIAGNRGVKYFDSISYYIYLVHGLFCMGSAFNVYGGGCIFRLKRSALTVNETTLHAEIDHLSRRN